MKHQEWAEGKFFNTDVEVYPSTCQQSADLKSQCPALTKEKMCY